MHTSPRHDNRSFFLSLALTLASLAIGLALIATVFMRQSDTVEQTARIQTDSLTFMTFQFEREFLRFRNELQLAVESRETPNWTQVQLRFDILYSRAQLLMDNPTIQALQKRSEYTEGLPPIMHLLEQVEAVMETPWNEEHVLREALATMHIMGPDVQSMSLAADRLIANLVDDQIDRLREQNRWIVWLMAMQVVVLLVAAAGLWWRHRRQLNERRALEVLNQELIDATQTAEKANRAKSQFLANMSHELRTPFNGMLGMIQLLEESDLTDTQREQLMTAKTSARHLLSILNDILDMSALDAGKLKFKPEVVDMPSLLRDIHQLFVQQGRLKGLRMPIDFAPDCPTWVLTDPTRTRQIVLNLMNNALKFTSSGHVQVSVRCTRHDQQVEWQIAIEDSGIGIEADKLAQLFQRFQQADDSATRRFGGTGLGLDISRKLARLMQGDIVASSQRGQGSIFTVSLVTPIAEQPASAPALHGLPHPASDNRSSAQSLRILVAEDHPINRQFVGMLLSKLGHEVTFAENGLIALNLVRDGCFDVVLMDIHMPEMDGLESTRHIRNLPGQQRRVPIIALSADVMNEANDRAMEAGMNAFVAKPVQKHELQAVMLTCLAQSALPA